MSGGRGHIVDLTGRRFGRLLVIERAENSRQRTARWVCRCECGTIKVFRSRVLLRGDAESCDCLRRERASLRCTRNTPRLRHGHARAGKWSPEFRAWSNMRRRCYDVRNIRYARYGGRGILVCQAWRESFEAFLDDMGLKPNSRMSLDRINNDGNYEPGNCRWATASQQARNRRLRNSRPVVGAWLI